MSEILIGKDTGWVRSRRASVSITFGVCWIPTLSTTTVDLTCSSGSNPKPRKSRPIRRSCSGLSEYVNLHTHLGDLRAHIPRRIESDKHLSFNPLDFRVHPWEILFYALFYHGLAEGGSCFGTCLEALYARERLSLFLEPVLDNPFNPYQRNHPAGGPASISIRARQETSSR